MYLTHKKVKKNVDFKLLMFYTALFLNKNSSLNSLIYFKL